MCTCVGGRAGVHIGRVGSCRESGQAEWQGKPCSNSDEAWGWQSAQLSVNLGSLTSGAFSSFGLYQRVLP